MPVLFSNLRTHRRLLGVACALALAIVGGTLGAAAESARALVNNCAAGAVTGCITNGYHTYQESRSMKTGAGADHICVALVRSDGSTYHPGLCGFNTTFVRLCSPHIPPQALTAGLHWGSSNAWTVDGRSATASDATVCVA